MGLIEDIGAGKVGVDTSIFIYLIEKSPIWLPLVRPLFLAADAGTIGIVTSSITLPEVLVMPDRVRSATMAEY